MKQKSIIWCVALQRTMRSACRLHQLEGAESGSALLQTNVFMSAGTTKNMHSFTDGVRGKKSIFLLTLERTQAASQQIQLSQEKKASSAPSRDFSVKCCFAPSTTATLAKVLDPNWRDPQAIKTKLLIVCSSGKKDSFPQSRSCLSVCPS